MDERLLYEICMMLNDYTVFPEITCEPLSDNAYKLYYGEIAFPGIYDNKYAYDDPENSAMKDIIEGCIIACRKFQRKLKISKKCIFMMLNRPLTLYFMKQITSTGDDAIN